MYGESEEDEDGLRYARIGESNSRSDAVLQLQSA